MRYPVVVWKAGASRVPAQRLSHPKGGASAQQPEAERASNSAVVRPQAAGKSRSTNSAPIGWFVCHCTDGLTVAVVMLPESNSRQNAPAVVQRFTLRRRPMGSLKRKNRWFKPTRRGWFSLFLVQDRLCASDVLHRDWDWSGWL